MGSDKRSIVVGIFKYDLVAISWEEYRSVQKITQIEDDKCCKILSVMKLEGKNWKVEGQGGEWSARPRANL